MINDFEEISENIFFNKESNVVNLAIVIWKCFEGYILMLEINLSFTIALIKESY